MGKRLPKQERYRLAVEAANSGQTAAVASAAGVQPATVDKWIRDFKIQRNADRNALPGGQVAGIDLMMSEAVGHAGMPSAAGSSEARDTLTYQSLRNVLADNPHDEPGLYRAEWIVRETADTVDNSASWIMQHAQEYADPVASLTERLRRCHLKLDHDTLTAMSTAMLDAYNDI